MIDEPELCEASTEDKITRNLLQSEMNGLLCDFAVWKTTSPIVQCKSFDKIFGISINQTNHDFSLTLQRLFKCL